MGGGGDTGRQRALTPFPLGACREWPLPASATGRHRTAAQPQAEVPYRQKRLTSVDPRRWIEAKERRKDRFLVCVSKLSLFLPIKGAVQVQQVKGETETKEVQNTEKWQLLKMGCPPGGDSLTNQGLERRSMGDIRKHKTNREREGKSEYQ